MTIVIASELVPVPVALVAVRVTVLVVAAVGVPLMTPVDGSMVRPGGSPVAPKLVGVPEAVTVNVKAVPTVPLAVAELVITGAAPVAATDTVSVADPVPPALVAEIVTVLTATAVGVPLIRPVAVLMARPAGSPVAPNKVGELLAVIA